MVAYTEEGHIERVLKEYYKEIYLYLPKNSEFIVYLDKPNDKTPEIVKKLSKKIKLKVIEGKKNLGYAGAMSSGLKAAKNDIVFYSDSSGKHQARDFWKLIKQEKNYDIITGLRSPRTDPLIRRGITFIQRIIVSLFFSTPFYDFNTGYKIIHKNIIENVLDDCKYMKQSFSSELLVRAYKKGYTIKNIKVIFKDRIGKNTGTNYRNLPKIIKKSLRGYFLLKRELLRN